MVDGCLGDGLCLILRVWWWQHNNNHCTAIHVRRGDIAFGKGRRYAAVDEYLEAGKVKPGQVVRAQLDRIEKVDPKTGAYQVVYAEVAMKAAEKALASGRRIRAVARLGHERWRQ